MILTGVTFGTRAGLTEVPVPTAPPGWVLVKREAFGLNHSEQILRLSEVRTPYIPKPIIPGIKYVGEVVGPSDSGLAKEAKPAAVPETYFTAWGALFSFLEDHSLEPGVGAVYPFGQIQQACTAQDNGTVNEKTW